MTTTPTTDRPILIAYDGSDGARAAIAATADMFPGASAVVVYARQPLEAVAAHLEGHAALEEIRRIDVATVDASDRIAGEGATYANDRGLAAQARVSSTNATASVAVAEAAEEVDARLIVVGSRGRGGSRSALLGSTSTNVLHHTSRPTLVIAPHVTAHARRAAIRTS